MTLVKEIMSRNPMYLAPNDLITKARSIMRDYGYRSIPIIEKNKLVGIISRNDILKVTSNKTDIEISGIMNRNVVLTSPKESIFSTGKKIIDFGIRQLPVIDNETLVGIISSMDILRSLVKDNHYPKIEEVRDVMNPKAIYCKEDDELSSVWDKIQKHGFSGLPVVVKGKVTGMITRGDILKHGSFRLSKESGKVRNIPVNRLMKKPPIVAEIETKIIKAAELMIKNRISRLPIVDKNKTLLGIVDVEDILRAYITTKK